MTRDRPVAAPRSPRDCPAIRPRLPHDCPASDPWLTYAPLTASKENALNDSTRPLPENQLITDNNATTWRH
eukprot:9667447-Lingulodinium_polyedra.AAC.1